MNVCDVEAKPSGCCTVDIDIDKAPAGYPFGVNGCRSRHVLKHGLYAPADFSDYLEIGPGNLDTDWGFDSGCEHVQPGLDGHDPNIGKTRDVDQFIEFGPN